MRGIKSIIARAVLCIAVLSGSADFTVSIMLADEVYVAKLHTDSRDVALKPMRMGHPQSNISLYTTANALRALLNGRIGWQEAVYRDLVVLTSRGRRQEQVNALLSNTLSGSSLSN